MLAVANSLEPVIPGPGFAVFEERHELLAQEIDH